MEAFECAGVDWWAATPLDEDMLQVFPGLRALSPRQVDLLHLGQGLPGQRAVSGSPGGHAVLFELSQTLARGSARPHEGGAVPCIRPHGRYYHAGRGRCFGLVAPPAPQGV